MHESESTTPSSGYDSASNRVLFDRLAAVYDSPETRFFPFCADRLVDYLRPRPGSRALDIATGTGAVAVPLAQAVGAAGRVHAIDISAAMLDQAERNLRKMNLSNVDLHEMDASRLDFKSGYFHYVTCSYGLFFLPDMLAALREWWRVLRPGGTLVFTSFEKGAFQPMLDDLVGRLDEHGVRLPDGPFGSRRIESIAHCETLLENVGFAQIEVVTRQLGYHLPDENAWWKVIECTAMHQLYQRVEDPAARDRLRNAHLTFVRGLTGGDGLWLDVETRFARGVKPG